MNQKETYKPIELLLDVVQKTEICSTSSDATTEEMDALYDVEW